MDASRPRSLSSLTGAFVVWSTHFLLCYIAVSLACIYGWSGARLAVAAFTCIALVLLAWMGWRHYRLWQAARRPGATDAALPAFLSLVAMMLCALATLALVWVALPAALLPTCAA